MRLALILALLAACEPATELEPEFGVIDCFDKYCVGADWETERSCTWFDENGLLLRVEFRVEPTCGCLVAWTNSDGDVCSGGK